MDGLILLRIRRWVRPLGSVAGEHYCRAASGLGPWRAGVHVHWSGVWGLCDLLPGSFLGGRVAVT